MPYISDAFVLQHFLRKQPIKKIKSMYLWIKIIQRLFSNVFKFHPYIISYTQIRNNKIRPIAKNNKNYKTYMSTSRSVYNKSKR